MEIFGSIGLKMLIWLHCMERTNAPSFRLIKSARNIDTIWTQCRATQHHHHYHYDYHCDQQEQRLISKFSCQLFINSKSISIPNICVYTYKNAYRLYTILKYLWKMKRYRIAQQKRENEIWMKWNLLEAIRINTDTSARSNTHTECGVDLLTEAIATLTGFSSENNKKNWVSGVYILYFFFS